LAATIRDPSDAAFERAREHGARVLQEPIEYEYGERECTVEDLAGHRWQFTQTLRDVASRGVGRRARRAVAVDAAAHPVT
jgi:uncharacterized glyoxalase superfamily protein PhnB